MARPQRRWWWQSHLFDNDGGKLLRAFERRRRLARLHDASPEAQRSHRASRSAEGDGRLCACDVATKNSPQTKCLSQLSQFQSVSQLNGDGVKVRGWQSDSLEPAAFVHSWYLCYKALVEGWEQVRVTRMRSTCTPRTRDIEGSRPLGFTAQLQFLVVARFQPATSHRFPYRQGHFHIDLHQEARHPVCYTCNTLLLLSPVKFVKL